MIFLNVFAAATEPTSPTSDIVSRTENATSESLVTSIQNVANGLYEFILSLSDSMLLIGIVIVIIALIVGVFTGMGKALRVALVVVIAYFVIVYAPEIIGLIKTWISGTGTGTGTAKPGG